MSDFSNARKNVSFLNWGGGGGGGGAAKGCNLKNCNGSGGVDQCGIANPLISIHTNK